MLALEIKKFVDFINSKELQPTVVLTPNKRLSEFFHKQYDHHQQSQNLTCWPSLAIMPLNSWFLQLWQEGVERNLLEPLFLLNEWQESYVWQEVIEASNYKELLLQTRSIAELAMDAWNLCLQWQLFKYQDTFTYASHDARIFLDWADKFSRHCQTHNFIIRQQLPDKLLQLGESLRPQLQLPKRIILVGFDEIVPQWQALFTVFKNMGCEIEHYKYNLQEVDPTKIALNSAETEIYTMARWAKIQLENNPGARIACIVPDLTARRAQITQIFTKLFHLDEYLQQRLPQQLLFDISIGQPLSTCPAIHSALLALQMIAQTHWQFADIQELLHSPFIAGTDEYLARAALVVKLQQQGSHKITKPYLLKLAHASCPILAEKITAMAMACGSGTALSLPSVWAAQWQAELQGLAWLEGRELNSSERQQLARWQELLAQFATLDQVSSTLSRQQALNLLQQFVSTTVFQAQAEPAPIQILGLLEAAGLPFDRLWIMGAYDEIWPVAPKPNPFIPLELQRRLKLPHATATRELEFYRRLTQGFCQSASQVIFSYPQFDADRHLRVSPLIKGFADLTELVLELPQLKLPEKQVQQVSQLEHFVDDIASELTQTRVKGGTSLFKDQAACPFRATANFRLGAKTLPELAAGLSALERGSLLHKTLQYWWLEVKSQQQFLKMDETQVQELLQHCIEKACIANDLQSAAVNIEKLRLHKLLLTWLQLEKDRPPFEILAVETKHLVKLGELEFELQIDRMDKLQQNDEILIIDYKTGKPVIKDLLGERPNEPQLLLYGVTSELPITAIAFAQINVDKLAFLGIANEDLAISGIKELAKHAECAPNWSEQLTQWRQILENLAEQYRRGYAKVDPKEGDKTCRYCNLQSFCRVYEHAS